ncbi:MAG: HAMP domain-containing sensor histidine kinase [Planctomycetota bacterium]
MDTEQFRTAVEHAKLEALKEFAYGAGHEINNPLANIAGRAQTLLKTESDGEKRKALESIHRQAMRAHGMIADLMLFARPPALEPLDFPLPDLVDELIDEFKPLATDRSVDLTATHADSRGVVCGDRTHLGVAIGALIENAIEAVSPGGEVNVSWRTAAEQFEIAVRDNGPGVSAEERERLFDPFYSGREAGRGLGFGLCKCWRIVTDHGGTITVESPPAAGATFTIALPRPAAVADPGASTGGAEQTRP